MNLLISTSAKAMTPEQAAKAITKAQETIAVQQDIIAKAKAVIAEAKKSATATKNIATLKARGKVSFKLVPARGKAATFTNFKTGFDALQKSSFGHDHRSSTLFEVAKDGTEKPIASKRQKQGYDKPMPAIYFTAYGKPYAVLK